MSTPRRLPALVLLVGLALSASGCPLTLEDDFHLRTTGDAGEAVAGEDSNGGNETRGGNGGAGTPVPGGGDSVGGTMMAFGGQSGGQAGDGSGAATTCACGPNETCCPGEICADLRFDDKNCRTCGKECPGTTCDNGSCTNECVLGRADCNRNLVDGCEVDPGIDPKNCGNCGIACGFQMECVGGQCACPIGTANCDGSADNGCETDIYTDSRSCGACGKACGVHEQCRDGSCACAPSFADCNQDPSDGCEASLADPATCGSCLLDCGVHGTCIASGQCGCSDGFLDCSALTPGCETAKTDPLHCGTCDQVCDVAAPACDGTSCSTGCGALTKCGSSCVDLTQDPQNCGMCGNAVGAHQLCIDGKPECISGFADCDGDPSECEADIDQDPLHCGDCRIACKPGALCGGGNCACAPSTPNDCGSSCEACCSDSQCSDGNSCTADTCDAGICTFGTDCASGGTCCAKTGCFECCGDTDCSSGKICTGNKCVTLTCTLPLIACNSKCVDPRSDAAHCGGCGNSCGAGRTCSTSSCTPKWVGLAAAPEAFAARQKAAYTAVGSKVFAWGGVNASGSDLNDGALYDAASDTWSVISSTGAVPTGRVLASAVWTGSVVVVWGGGDAAGNADFTSGGRYDPNSDTWLPMSTEGAPAGRRAAHAVWTGSRMLVFAGYDRFGFSSATLALYDPVNDKWSATSTNNRPAARNYNSAAWTGSQLLVYGGQLLFGASSETHGFDPVANQWQRLSDGPSGRYGTFNAWDGSIFFVWGGWSGPKNDGGTYIPAQDSWSTAGNSGPPSARWAPQRQAGWSARIKPNVTLLLGGIGSNSSVRVDGALYNSSTKAWTAVPAWPSGVSHQWGVGVWTGTEFVLWGGLSATGSTLTAVGERYLP